MRFRKLPRSHYRLRLDASRTVGEIQWLFHALPGQADRSIENQNEHARLGIRRRQYIGIRQTRIAWMHVKSAQSVFMFNKSFALRIFVVALVLRLIPVI